MSLFRTAARTAVASSVHGRVQRRQQSRWAAESQTAAAPQPAVAAPAATPPPPAPDTEALLSALERLATLHAGGVLTDAEFQAQKARILAH
jgi:hypothetical protein